MMAGRAAVIVKINAVPDATRHEAQHFLPLVLYRIPVIPHLPRHTEVNAEARSQALHPRRHPMSLKYRFQPCIQVSGDSEDVIVEPTLTVRCHRGQPGGDGNRMAVVSAAVLAVSR